MKQKVVVIGHGYTSRLGVIRSLSGLNCDITVIAIVFHGRIGRFIRFEGGRPVDCHSKFVNRIIYCNVKRGDDLVKLLLKRCTSPDQKVILIPVSDFSAAVIDNNQEQLKDFFVFPHIHHSPGAVEYWMNKSFQKDLARSVGLNVTQGQIVRIKDGQYVFPRITQYPCFTKSLVTNSGGKQFLKRCDNMEDLQRVLDSVCRIQNTEVLVEDYKKISSEYAVVGFSDGKEVFIPGVIKFTESSQSHKGIAREGLIMPVGGFKDLIDLFKKYVMIIGYYGLFDIDFFESEGKLYFCEINLRFGGSGFAYTAMGCNLPKMFVRSLNGESIEDMNNDVAEEATYVNERMCIDDWVAGAVSKQDMTSIINQAKIRFVYDDFDIGPQRKLERYMRGQSIKVLLKRWLRKGQTGELKSKN